MDLIAWSAVVTANQFNPTIVTPDWLKKLHVIGEDELEAPTILADGVSQIQTRLFQLLVVPQMLQFVTKPNTDNEGQVVSGKVGPLLDALPHTPFTGIGLNFTWAVGLGRETAQVLTRRLFYMPQQRPFPDFDTPDARFGVYMSHDFGNVRLKLDIKPGVLHRPGEPDEERLLFIFNFHKSVEPSACDLAGMHQVLQRWDAVKTESQRIVRETATWD